MKNLIRILDRYFALLGVSFFLLFSTATLTVQAQSVWLPNATDKGIGLEIMKPFFDEDPDFGPLTSVQIISGRFRVSDKLLLKTELPFSYFNSDYDDAEFTIGNPYLGLVFGESDNSYFLEVGLNAPLASDEKGSASFIGAFTDYDRMEAFVPDLFAISLKNHYLYDNTSNLLFGFMGGFTAWIPTDDSRADTEVLSDYSGHIGYDGDDIQVLGTLSGRLIISESHLDFGERTIHQFGISARLKTYNVQPGILIKVPLDEDLNDFINFTLGVNLLVNFD